MRIDLGLLINKFHLFSMIYNKDFKQGIRRTHQSRQVLPQPGIHWKRRITGLAAGLFVLGVVIAKTHDSTPEEDPILASASLPTITEALLVPASYSVPSNPILRTPKKLLSGPRWTEITVKKGDSTSTLFDQLNIHSQLHAVMRTTEAKKMLQRIRPGDKLKVLKDGSRLLELSYRPDATHRLEVTRSKDGYQAKILEDRIETRDMSAHGEISNSLFVAGKKAGISDNLIMQLVGIFSYDIDFALDIRKGDSFHIIYQERYSEDGRKLKNGPILAAQFVNRGHIYRALRYTDKKGNTDYYTPSGRSLKKAFIRTPVRFSRISSHFNPNRRHPILHTIRAHKGVDYAASTGTAVKATGNGRVKFAGRKGGYGNTIIIQHGKHYSTLYAHLNGFKRGLKKGKKVKQGQVIGYVGHTGRATGPHLHYEFRVNGVHKNPLTVKLPKAAPLPRSALTAFKQQIKPLLAQLKAATLVATK